MRPKPATNIQPIASRNHDVQQKECWRLPFGVWDHIIGGMKNPGCKSSGLKMMLYEPRYVRVVFQYKYGLAQPECLSPATCGFLRRPPSTGLSPREEGGCGAARNR
jgi:hypothetical protein